MSSDFMMVFLMNVGDLFYQILVAAKATPFGREQT